MSFNRADICKIVNELSESHATQERAAGIHGIHDFDLKAAYNHILDYCRDTETRPRSHEYSMSNGALFIDGVISVRVAPLINRPCYTRRGAFPSNDLIDYEGLILARQESNY